MWPLVPFPVPISSRLRLPFKVQQALLPPFKPPSNSSACGPSFLGSSFCVPRRARATRQCTRYHVLPYQQQCHCSCRLRTSDAPGEPYVPQPSPHFTTADEQAHCDNVRRVPTEVAYELGFASLGGPGIPTSEVLSCRAKEQITARQTLKSACGVDVDDRTQELLDGVFQRCKDTVDT